MNKRGRIAIFEISNLVLAIIAFSFLVGLTSVEIVSGQSSISPSQININTATREQADAQFRQSLFTGAGGLATSVIPTTSGSHGESTETIITPPGGPESAISTIAKTPSYYTSSEAFAYGKIQIPEGTMFNYDPTTKLYSAKGIDGTFTPEQMTSMGENVGTGIDTPFGNLGSVGAGWADALIGSLTWAIGAAVMVYSLASMFGASPDQSKALAIATFAGTMGYKIATDPSLLSLGAGYGLLIGVGIGLIILEMMWTKSSKKTVTFQCTTYEAPTGGQYCELCNQDPMRACSEYRCKSLGQACQLLNAGTKQEACAWVNRQDVTSPTIQPWYSEITKDHSYKNVNIRPPATGMRIINDLASDGCIKAFTPLKFGISTNEPTQCKIDYNHTTTIRDVKQAYTSMAYFFGESSLYAYNHTETLRLPGPTAINESGGVEIIHDGTFTLYVRCQDANGNINEDEYAIRFCVEKGPDTTPAKIEGTSVGNGMPVKFDTQSLNLEVYTNEPADCKWSRQDKDYELMETEMDCDSSVWDINSNMLYKCLTKLNGIENRKDNEYYFRCRDQPNAALADRNTNVDSYKYTVKGSQPLNVVRTSPNNVTIRGFTNVVPVDLEVETINGFNKGEAICAYNEANLGRDCSSIRAEDYLQMFETNSNKHKQRQDLSGGEHTYCLKCMDLGGNTNFSKVTFNVEIDRASPAIVRVYNEGNNLKIVTDEISTCTYSQVSNLKCNFEMDKGTAMIYVNATEHYTEWKPNTFFYIKCVDASGNQPDPDVCSITVKPYNQA